MVKRISISKIALSTFVFTMLCLLPSAATAQTPGEPQQGAINTSESNLKNTNRTGTTRFDPLVLDLKKASGEKVLTRQIADLDNDGKISGAESAFDFDVLPAGDYVLTISRLDGKIATLESDLTARVIVTGAAEGKIEKDWKLKTDKAADASRENQSLGGLGSQVNGLKIPFKADGKMSIAGKITVATGKVIVKDIKHR